MPDYQFTDPKTGRTLRVNGPTPPSEGMLAQLFADAEKQAPSAQNQMTPTPPSPKDQFLAQIRQKDPNAVTLGDLIADPHGALSRMVTLAKQGVIDAATNPRIAIPAALGAAYGLYKGAGIGSAVKTVGDVEPPAAQPAVEPSAQAPGLIQRLQQNVDPAAAADAISVVSPRAGAAVRTVARLAGKLTPTEAAPPAAEPTPAPQPVAALPKAGSFEDFVLKKYGPNATHEQILAARRSYTEAGRAAARTSPTVTPAAPAPTPVATAPTSAPTADVAATPPAPSGETPTETAPAPKVTPKPAPKAKATAKAATTPSADTGELPSLDDLHLTPAEITQAVKWHENGVAPEVILHRILQSRQLTSRIGASTPDEAAAAIAQRNRTGKWPD